MRHVLSVAAFALAMLFVSNETQAQVLARAQLPTPLAPQMPSHLSVPMPANVDPAQPIWVSYRVLAMSAASSPTGEIVLDGSFEGVQTPIHQTIAHFSPDKMAVTTSAGTIAQQFAATYGQRSPDELRAAFGPELYQAYEAVNAGTGRLLDGTIVKTLPALGKNEGMLLVSVDRANGIRPVGIFVTVGQGEIPAEFQAGAGASADGGASSSPTSSSAYRIGRILGILTFLGLLYWVFVGRHKQRR